LSAPVIHVADLEPFEVGLRTYATRRRLGRFDATTVLCVMIGLLTLFPEQQILPGTSYAARPALLVCLIMFVWWVVARMSPWLPVAGRQPMRWALFAFVMSNLVSYAIGFLRGLTPMESNAADNSMVVIAELAGVILITADGVANWGRLRTLLRFFIGCCCYMSVIAMVQYMAKFDITEYMYLPGLEVKGVVNGLQPRGTEIRAAATALHYIELSTVLAIALPLALHFGRFAVTQKSKRIWAGISLMLLTGNLVTLSRTGMVAIVIGLLTLLPMWDWRRRYNTLVAGAFPLAAVAVAKPSLARTLFDLFAGASQDDSITSRTERYGMVGYYFSQRPWFGRGSGTWVSPQYHFLDNSWLVTALTNGIVGAAALAGLFITGIVLASIALKRATNAEDKHLCATLIASQLISIFATATYDSFYFTTGAVIIVFSTGLCATAWRLTHLDRSVRTAAPRRSAVRTGAK